VTLSALATTLFLGGWRAPAPISTVWSGANSGWWPLLWFLAKLILFIFFFIWLRGALPRVRYDQLMKLGWKVLMPVSLGWILLVATLRALRNNGADTSAYLVVAGIVVLALLAGSFAWDAIRRPQPAAEEPAPEQPAELAVGAFPVPPLDAPHYHGKEVPSGLH
jgi:NADH-quinone oxidoreductase subunit H